MNLKSVNTFKSKPWMNFLKKSKNKFDEKNIKITNNNDKEVILIESRTDIMIEYVIKNAMYFLHKEWNLTIIHGNDNEDYLKLLVKDLGNIKLINYGIDNYTPTKYNKLLTNKNFYNLIENEIFLIIQLDVLITKNIPKKYLQYSYIGAPWVYNYGVPCGNGGFSLRNKKDMLHILDKIPLINLNEDYYFSKQC